MLEKRGQVTIFIIIGVLVVALVILLIYFKEGVFGKALEAEEDDIFALSQEAVRVRTYVDSCFDQALKDTLYANAIQGGYSSNVFGLNYSINDFDYVYYIEDGQINIPIKNKLENEIEIGVKRYLITCINFSEFSYDLNYDLADIQVESFIEDDKVKIKALFPITVTAFEVSSSFKFFTKEVFTNYSNYYKLAVDLTEEQEKHLDDFCISCAEIYASSYGLEAETVDFVDGNHYVIVYYLSNPETETNDPVEIFLFAHKFNLEEI